MKAFLMCAGLGIRLMPLTKNMAKPMIRLNNYPIILNAINLLKSYGISDIIINLHHLPETISNYLKDGSDFGVRINYSYEENLLGTAGGLIKVKNYFSNNEPFIVMSGDGLTDIDLSDVINFHKNINPIATIVLKDYDFYLKYGTVDFDENSKIFNFLEKPSLKDIYNSKINTGIYVFNPEIFDFIEENTFQDFANLIFPKILKCRGSIYAYETKNYWCDIGDIDTYLLAQKDILKENVITYFPKNNTKTNVIVGENCNISKNVIFDGFNVLGNNVNIEDYVYMKDNIVYDNVTIKNNSTLNKTILCDNTIIRENTNVYHGVFL